MRRTILNSHLTASTALTSAAVPLGAALAATLLVAGASLQAQAAAPPAGCTINGTGTAGSREVVDCSLVLPPYTWTTMGSSSSDYVDLSFTGGTTASPLELFTGTSVSGYATTTTVGDNNNVTFKTGVYSTATGGGYVMYFAGATNTLTVNNGAEIDLSNGANGSGAAGLLYNYGTADATVNIASGATISGGKTGIDGVMPKSITINGSLVAGTGAGIRGSVDEDLGTTITIGTSGTVSNTSTDTATITTAGEVIASYIPSTQGPLNIVINGAVINNATDGAAIDLSGGFAVVSKIQPDAATGAVVAVASTGRIVGTSLLTGSDDALYLYAGASVSDTFDAGDGDDVLGLLGTGSASIDITNTGLYQNFESLQKSGSSTWYLTGSGTFTEAYLSAGTLEVNGTLTAPLTVSGGVLRGTGTIVGDVTLSGSPVVSPGKVGASSAASSIGTLNVTGKTVFSSGSTLLTEIKNDGTSDRLAVTGSATLAGRVRVNPASGTYTDGDEWTILTASAGYSGTFSGGVSFVNGNAIDGTSMNILYRGNTVVLQLAADEDDTEEPPTDGCSGNLNECDNTYNPGSSDLGSGSTVDGGDGDDTVTLDSTGSVGATFKNFEHLVVDGASPNIAFEADLSVDDTTIDAGILRFNGTLDSPIVTIGANGGLGGRGTIRGNVTNSGNIAPGNSIDTLTVDGNVTFAAGSKLVAEIAQDGTADKLVVTGRTTIASTATITVQVTSDTDGSYAYGDEFLVLDSAKRSGTFGGVSVVDADNLLDGMRVQTIYDGADVYLRLMPERFRPIALNTPARIAASKGLDRAEAAGATGDMATVINALWSQSLGDIATSLNRIHPEWVDAHAETGLTHLPQIRGAIGQRLDLLRGTAPGSVAAAGVAPVLADIGQAGGGARSAAAPSAGLITGLTGGSRDLAAIGNAVPQLGVSSMPEVGGAMGFWVAGVGDLRSLGSEADHLSYDVHTHGAVAGVDKRFTDSLSAGIAFSALRSDIEHDIDHRDDQQRSYIATVYGQQTYGAWFAQADAAFGVTRHDSERETALNRVATSSWDGWQLGASVTGGAAFGLGEGWTVTPTATLGLDHLHQDSFSEQGAGALNLNVDSRDDTQLSAGLKASVSRPFAVSNATLTPAAGLGVRADVPLGGRRIDASLAGGGSAFSIEGRQDAEVIAAPSLSLSVDFKNGVSLFSGYQGEFGQETTAHGVRAGLLVTW